MRLSRFHGNFAVPFPAGLVLFFAASLLFSGTLSFGAADKNKRPAPALPAQTPAPGESAAAPQGATTTDLSALSVTRNVLFIRLNKGFYQIREVFLFQNSGQATIVSRNGAPTIRLVLPKSDNIRNSNSQLMEFPQGLDRARTRIAGDQILSNEPIPPGTKIVALVYRLADEFGGIMVQRPISYATKSFAILPEKDRVQTGMNKLVRGDEVKFQGVTYDSFAGATTAGSVVGFSLKAPDSMGGLGYFYAVGGALAGLGVFLALFIRVRRKKGLAHQVEREELIRSLAALDDRLAQGQIATDEHLRQRAPRFERLREISR